MTTPASVIAPFTYRQPTYAQPAQGPRFTIQDFPGYEDGDLIVFQYELRGQLATGYHVRGMVRLSVVFDPEEVVIAEPRFHMHASAPTFPEAIQVFGETLVDYLELLGERQATLGMALQDQLAYLHSIIEVA